MVESSTVRSHSLSTIYILLLMPLDLAMPKTRGKFYLDGKQYQLATNNGCLARREFQSS